MRFDDLFVTLRESILRGLGALRPARRRQDLEDELKLHLELAEEEFRSRGRSPEDAARMARIRHGGSVQAMETLRDQQGLPWLGALWLDTKLGLRMLRRSWGVTLVGGLAIAVVIGLAAAVFSVLDRVEGSALPLEEGDRLIAIQPYDPVRFGELDTSLPDFRRWRRELRSVVNIGAYRTITNLYLTLPRGSGGRVSVAAMTASAFGLARIQPLLGRGLLPEDERIDAERVVVIAYEIWESRFGLDPGVLGQQIRLDQQFHTIVGVMPRGFAFPVNHRFWIPLSTDPLVYPDGGPQVFVIARLAPGSAIETARAEVATLGLLPPDLNSGIIAGFRRPTTADVDYPIEIRVVPYAFTFTDQIRDDRWQYRFALMLIGLLLIPPTANIAILLYARNMTRQEEFAARYVLGASRKRIVSQLFVESLVLAVIAGGVGLLIAREGLSRFQGSVDQEFGSTMPFWMDFGLSLRALPLVMGLVVLAALIAGVVPALWATGRWRQSGLHSLGHTSGGRLGKTWRALVVSQVAITTAVVPLVGAGTWLEMRTSVLEPGYAPDEFLSARVEMDAASTPDAAGDFAVLADHFGELQLDLAERLEAQPGIHGVTLSAWWPTSGGWAMTEVDAIDGRALDPFRASVQPVDRSYFDLFDIRFLNGRGFLPDEFERDRGSVIVNQTFVNDIVGDPNPLGRRLRYLEPGPGRESERWYEIVGVVEDVPAHDGRRRVYHPMRPGEAHPVWVTLRVGATPDLEVTGRIWEVTTSMEPELRVRSLRDLNSVNEQAAFIDRVERFAPAGAAIVVVLFSIAGIHTLTAFTVATRTREIGIRSALGAHPRRLVLDVLGRALVPIVAGSVCGLFGAALVSAFLSWMMMDEMSVSHVFATALAVSVAAMLMIALVASAGPARRALKVDPTEALREG